MRRTEATVSVSPSDDFPHPQRIIFFAHDSVSYGLQNACHTWTVEDFQPYTSGLHRSLILRLRGETSKVQRSTNSNLS